MAKVFLRIFRYDPSTDDQPYYTDHELVWKPYLTLLEALHAVNDCDEQITFDYSCRGSFCGRCSVMVNGRPVLACYHALEEGGRYLIEPLKGFPVIRDLTVDKSQMMRQLQSAQLQLQTMHSLRIEDAPKIDYREWWETLERLNMCRECGMCLSVCPVYQENRIDYAGPAALGQIVLRSLDHFDEADRLLQAKVAGIDRCLLCGCCDNVCPSYIKHTDLFRKYRDDFM